jgi:hypothetical protein
VRSGSIESAVRRSRLYLLVFATLTLGAAMAPGTAAAACPLGPGPIWAEAAAFGVHDTPVEPILARPGTLLGVSNDDWADSYRSRGAETAGWHMRLPAIVGTLSNPKTRDAVRTKVPGLSNLAHRITTCDPPWLALNEMLTVQSPEPIGYGQRRFRENVLVLAKELDARGVRVILFMPRIPHAKTRYRTYWRTLSRYTDYVYEAYTWKTREAIRRSDAGARKYFRDKWTAAVKRLKSFTARPGYTGLMIPYWVNNRNSGRVGLSDAAWFRITRLKTEAVMAVGRNEHLATLWSWGWHTNRNVGEVDPDKPKAACVYLHTRDPLLCDPSSM